VTAAHCLNGAPEFEVFHPLKAANRFKVAIKHVYVHRDLAILEYSISMTEYIELGPLTGSPIVGTNTLAAGFPTYGPGRST